MFAMNLVIRAHAIVCKHYVLLWKRKCFKWHAYSKFVGLLDFVETKFSSFCSVVNSKLKDVVDVIFYLTANLLWSPWVRNAKKLLKSADFCEVFRQVWRVNLSRHSVVWLIKIEQGKLKFMVGFKLPRHTKIACARILVLNNFLGGYCMLNQNVYWILLKTNFSHFAG